MSKGSKAKRQAEHWARAGVNANTTVAGFKRSEAVDVASDLGLSLPRFQAAIPDVANYDEKTGDPVFVPEYCAKPVMSGGRYVLDGTTGQPMMRLDLDLHSRTVQAWRAGLVRLEYGIGSDGKFRFPYAKLVASFEAWVAIVKAGGYDLALASAANFGTKKTEQFETMGTVATSHLFGGARLSQYTDLHGAAVDYLSAAESLAKAKDRDLVESSLTSATALTKAQGLEANALKALRRAWRLTQPVTAADIASAEAEALKAAEAAKAAAEESAKADSALKAAEAAKAEALKIVRAAENTVKAAKAAKDAKAETEALKALKAAEAEARKVNTAAAEAAKAAKAAAEAAKALKAAKAAAEAEAADLAEALKAAEAAKV